MNRKLVLILSLVLSLTLATGGTLAYLQDTDADVNVMTLGNVHIEQHEFERVESVTTFAARSTTEGYIVQPFTQNKPLYPVVGTVTGWDEKPVYWAQLDEEHAAGSQKVLAGLTGVVDKFVLVENTGNSDAYVRTVFAFEMGSLSAERFDALLGINFNDAHWDWNFNLGTIEIDGNTYWLAEAVYKGSDVRHTGGLLSAEDYTYNSLAQVYLASAATNEDVEAIDGNGNGTYDIFVVSQAVQASGFESARIALDTAFGEVSDKSHPWMDGKEGDQEPDYVMVDAADELVAALTGGKNVMLTADVELDADDTITIPAGTSAELNLNGFTLAGTSDKTTGNAEMFLVKGELTVTGGTIEMESTVNQGWSSMATVFDVTAGGVLNIDDATITNLGGTDMNFCVHLNNWGEVTLNVNNSTLTATYCAVRVFNSGYDMNNVTIRNSTLTANSSAFWVHNYIGDLDSSKHTDEAIDARLNFDIFNGTNTFDCDRAVRYGFSNSIVYDAMGNVVE